MIGKQTKGTSFGGCVRYVLKEEKSKLLEVEGTPEQMAEQFELQSLYYIPINQNLLTLDRLYDC